MSEDCNGSAKGKDVADPPADPKVVELLLVLPFRLFLEIFFSCLVCLGYRSSEAYHSLFCFYVGQ